MRIAFIVLVAACFCVMLGAAPISNTREGGKLPATDSRSTYSAVDPQSYRTFKQLTIATSNYIYKPDVEVPPQGLIDQFTTTLVTTTSRTAGLHIEFSKPIFTSYPFVCSGATWAQNIAFKSLKWNFKFPGVGRGDTIIVTGYCAKAQSVAKYWWTDENLNAIGPVVRRSIPIANATGGFTMPNGINFVDAAFRAGGFPNGLLIGKEHSTDGLAKKYAWVLAPSYQEVMASLYTKGESQTGVFRGFSTLANARPLPPGQYESLSAISFDDVLLADLIALKVNVAASNVGVTPPGFGQLVFADTSASPFNDLSIDSICSIGDSLMEGTYDNTGQHVFEPFETFEQFTSLVERINGAFDGPIDTISFADSLKLTGTWPLSNVTYLHSAGSVSNLAREQSQRTPAKPMTYELFQNFPNPFNPTTTIQYQLSKESVVRLAIYNVVGQEVRTLVNEQEQPGYKSVQFDGSNLSSGVYFYRITAGNFTATKKLLLLK